MADTSQLMDNQADAFKPDGTLNDSIESQRVGEDRWDSDAYAARVTVQDFDVASNYRRQNHEWRWTEADLLFTGYTPQLFWEGSKIPRSSLSVFVAFEQIEAMQSRIIPNIFNDDPWFESIPEMGTSPLAAQRAGLALNSQLEHSNPREVVRLAFKSALKYGNGIFELYWDHREETTEQFLPVFTPEYQTRTNPVTFESFRVPTGEFKRSVKIQKVKTKINRPAFRNISLKDIFIDPQTPSPDIQKARYLIHRTFLTIRDLQDLRDTPGFKIPDDATLKRLVEQKPRDHSDNVKASAEASRGSNYDPNNNYTADPGYGLIEVLRRFSKDRLVWVLNNGQLCIYNEPSPFGFIPFYNIPYADMIDRFYGIAVTDVVEGEQRFQSKMLNNRVDEVALNLHPPTVVGMSGARLTPSQLRYRPGNVVQVEDASKDIQRQFPQNVSANSYAEIQQSGLRVQRSTGMNDSAILGAPTEQNPFGRSATGAGIQAEASIQRLVYIIENAETIALEPALRDAHRLQRKYLDPNEKIMIARGGVDKNKQIPGQPGAPQDPNRPQEEEPIEVDPFEIFNAAFTPRVRAGNRMRSKMGVLQTFPLVIQALSHPGMQQELRAQGETVDWKETIRVLLYAAGYSEKADIIRKLTPAEQQAFQQSQQQSPHMVELQKQRERMDKMDEMQLDKGEMEMAKAVLLEVLKGRNQATKPQPAYRQIGGGGGGNR